MKISPISFGINNFDKSFCAANTDFVQTTQRRNSLEDMDFNIIADTIRCQNLKNQMNVRLINLRNSLNSCMAQNLYSKNNSI